MIHWEPFFYFMGFIFVIGGIIALLISNEMRQEKQNWKEFRKKLRDPELWELIREQAQIAAANEYVEVYPEETIGFAYDSGKKTRHTRITGEPVKKFTDPEIQKAYDENQALIDAFVDEKLLGIKPGEAIVREVFDVGLRYGELKI